MASILSAGTTTATGLNLSADTTGVLQLASNNGTVGLTMDTSQNVGIGTSSPADKLQVVSSSRAIFYLDGANASGGSGGSAIILRKTGGNTAGSIANSGSLTGDSTENLLINANTNALVFSTGAAYTERARIDSSGNVGIATTVQKAKLQVNPGNVSTVGAIASSGLMIENYSGVGNLSQIGFGYATSSLVNTTAYIGLIETNYVGNGYGDLVFGTRNVTTDTAPTERMRIDSSGNVGIGTTSPLVKLHVSTSGNTPIINETTGGVTSYFNLRNTGGQAYIASNNNALVFAVTSGATEAARIDSSGNVLIGRQTGDGYRLSVAGTTQLTSGLQLTYSGAAASSISVTSGGAMAFGLDSSTGGTERMRIDSSGNLLVGTTGRVYNSNSNGSVFSGGQWLSGVTQVQGANMYLNQYSATGSSVCSYFLYNGAIVGTISLTSSATSYNTTSDQRLKENIQDAESASALIDALQVRQFDWKSDNSHQRYGFVAQELVTVAPEAVHQPVNEEEMMAVDYSKLVPMLVKAHQEQQALIIQLQADVAALKGAA